MKILVINTNGILRDGITAWMTSYFKAMDKSGMEVHTIAYKNVDADVVEEVREAGLIIHVIPHRKSASGAYLRELDQVMKNERFDIVQVNGNSATMSLELILAKMNGVRVRIAHSHNTTCSHEAIDRMLRPFLYAFSTDHFACGRAAGEWLFGSRRFSIIPNGKIIDLYRYSSDSRIAARRELKISDDCVAIGHVGMFNIQKNHSFLLDIFQCLHESSKKTHLFLIGEGGLRSSAEEKVQKMDLEESVTFLGKRSDVPYLLNAMDCMLFPSLHEGFPNVVLEWQINGLPSVVSNSITADCAITPLVRFCSLDEPVYDWASAVKTMIDGSTRKRDSEWAATEIAKAGYDIQQNAADLKRLYCESLARWK